jgi:hypothetical protein
MRIMESERACWREKIVAPCECEGSLMREALDPRLGEPSGSNFRPLAIAHIRIGYNLDVGREFFRNHLERFCIASTTDVEHAADFLADLFWLMPLSRRLNGKVCRRIVGEGDRQMLRPPFF